MSITTQSPVTDQHRQQYERDGYFLLESVVSNEHLEMLRAEVGSSIERINAEMDAKGVEKLGINLKNSRYFFGAFGDPQSRAGEFIFSDLMAEVCRATLGENAYLFHEQYVVKAAERGEQFSWHQDSGYVGYAEHKPYLTCWVTLDEVTEANGTVYILPYDRAGTRDYVPHIKDPKFNDLVGYAGDDAGIPILAPAGSIAVFSSTVFHRSGPNTTDKMRRVYLPQYSCEPILKPDGGGLRNLAEPFLVNGERVRRS